MVKTNLLKKKVNQSEFQRVLACVAYESCSKDVTVAKHEVAIYKFVHGQNDNANQFGLLLEGTNNWYKGIYKVVPNSSPTTKRFSIQTVLYNDM